MNFSVVLIARNEENTIPRLVKSLGRFQAEGGEIVVLDTGSTDKTAEICRKLGCKVEEVGKKFLHTIDKKTADAINERFIVGEDPAVVQEGDTLFDFASARNYAASLASNDMVAMPDADEIYTQLDLEKIQEEIANGVEQFEYQYVFAHDNVGQPTVQFLHSKFYNRTKMKWVGTVHEVLSGESFKKNLDESVIKLEHYQNEKTNRSGYLRGLALDCFLHPENDRNSHYFAREMYYTKRYDSAIKEFKRHISMNKWDAERSQSAVYIGDCYRFLGYESEGIGWYNHAFEIYSGRREPLFRLADVYFRRKDYQRTAVYALGSTTIPQTGFYMDNADHYRHVPHEYLYWSYWYLQKKDEAKKHFYLALEFNPKNDNLLRDKIFFE